ncbi:MAG: CHAT domain-containing protein [Hormoscilla sp.]
MLESALILADGKITLGQMLTPGWRYPQLEEVFLSCCETNLAWINITDDILTIAIGFICAGARSVIYTLWAVDDLATAIFSIFYHQYRKGTDKEPPLSRPQALQKAQHKLRTLTNLEVEQMLKSAERAAKQRGMKAKRAGKEEWSKLFALALKIKERQEQLKEFGEIPFASPQYWGAFICQGLR